MKRKHKIFFLFMTLLLMSSSFSQSHVDANSETTVVGSVKATLINVSAPANLVFSINPNEEKDNRFVSSKIEIVNNSNAPVKVKIGKGKDNFSLTKDSLWKPVNVLPSDYEWDKLGTLESESFISLGIQADTGSWKKISRSSVLYLKEQNDSLKDIDFGEIESHSSSFLKFVCSHGLSFSEEKECTYRIIWFFSLGE